jgi:hypothetical protein
VLRYAAAPRERNTVTLTISTAAVPDTLLATVVDSTAHLVAGPGCLKLAADHVHTVVAPAALWEAARWEAGPRIFLGDGDDVLRVVDNDARRWWVFHSVDANGGPGNGRQARADEGVVGTARGAQAAGPWS